MKHKFAKGILLGNTAVGKTTFLKAGHGQISMDNVSSVNINYSSFLIKNEISFRIYDTAGQEQFRSLLDQYFRGSHVVFFMTTCNDSTKAEDDRQFVDLMKLAKDKLKTFIPIFILNKIDLYEVDLEAPLEENTKLMEREEEIKRYINDAGLPFSENPLLYFVSCTLDYNVQNVIDKAYTLAIEQFGDVIRKSNEGVDITGGDDNNNNNNNNNGTNGQQGGGKKCSC